MLCRHKASRHHLHTTGKAVLLSNCTSPEHLPGSLNAWGPIAAQLMWDKRCSHAYTLSGPTDAAHTERTCWGMLDGDVGKELAKKTVHTASLRRHHLGLMKASLSRRYTTFRPFLTLRMSALNPASAALSSFVTVR